MKSKVVISGSVSLWKRLLYWKEYWEKRKCEVLDYPRPITSNELLKEYPAVYENFYKNITQTEILFVANENKGEVQGYIGSATFAEIAFAIAQNIIYGKKIKILLLQEPSSKVSGYDEIMLWSKLGRIEILNLFAL